MMALAKSGRGFEVTAVDSSTIRIQWDGGADDELIVTISTRDAENLYGQLAKTLAAMEPGVAE